jgi:hypothetical protein
VWMSFGGGEKNGAVMQCNNNIKLFIYFYRD